MKNIYLLVLLVVSTFSQEKNQTVTSPDSNFTVSTVLGYPIVYFTPDTRLAYGAGVQYFYRGNHKGKVSDIFPLFIYTQNKQLYAVLKYNMYFDQDNYHLNGRIGYLKFPRSYYGIGISQPKSAEEKYTPESVFLLANLAKRYTQSLNYGVGFDFTQTKIVETEEGGFLSETISDSDGEITSGINLFLRYDSRNHQFNATKGQFLLLENTFNDEWLGSDFTFQELKADYRYFKQVEEKNVFAIQIKTHFTRGTLPFTKLASLGGQHTLRGYSDRRFIDKQMLFTQAEYRRDLIWGFSGVVFASVGSVAPTFGQLTKYQHSVGFGGRYNVPFLKGVVGRMDIGFTNEGANFYLGINEIF